MFRKTDPNEWMWAHACELISQAERLHGQFFRLASSTRTQATWEPPIDLFEDEREVVVVIALPGVTAERVEVTAEPGAVVVRAERPVPFAGSRRSVRQLEIPYGFFERRIPLPEGRLEDGTQELNHGCLILRLRKVGERP
jgi:HSP20 family molecular chaperone IbpA